jgi:hypothetical protein
VAAAAEARAAATAEMGTTTTHVAAAATAEVAATAAHVVLGISQTRRTRYRQAEQQGSDCPQNVSRCVHFHHPVILARTPLCGSRSGPQ